MSRLSSQTSQPLRRRLYSLLRRLRFGTQMGCLERARIFKPEADGPAEGDGRGTERIRVVLEALRLELAVFYAAGTVVLEPALLPAK